MKLKLLLLSLLTLLGSITANANTFVVNGIKYNTLTDNKVEVISQSPKYSGSIKIPSTISNGGIWYNVTSIGMGAFLDCNGLTSITISNSVTSIGHDAFWGCTGLTSITIPNSVTSIGHTAFGNCSNLTSIIIPNSVTSIGDAAFCGCSGLASILVESRNTKYDSRNNCNAIIETATNTLIEGCKNTTIPKSVISIGNYAFYRRTSLTSITIPHSITSIGSDAFRDCSGLTSITIPNSVTSIGYYAFTDYSYSHSLTSVIIEWETPISIDSNTFSKRADATLYVPYGSKAAYEAADYWKEFKKIVEVGKSIVLTDATAYQDITEQFCETLTYTRTFNNTNWQALYVPFSMSYNDWKDDFDVARIIAYFPFYATDGSLTKAELVMSYIQSGSLLPNHPYFIKAKSTGTKTITLTNTTLYPSEENSIDCSTVETKCTFTGTYDAVQGANKYVMGGGTLGKLGSSTLSPMRWYMTIESRGSQIISTPANIKLRVVDEDEATGILQQLSERHTNEVYDIYGRRIDEMPIQRGIYIIEGKKVFIK